MFCTDGPYSLLCSTVPQGRAIGGKAILLRDRSAPTLRKADKWDTKKQAPISAKSSLASLRKLKWTRMIGENPHNAQNPQLALCLGIGRRYPRDSGFEG